MKINHQMSISDVENILRQRDTFKTFGITQLGIFGSFVRGEPYQDIDFLLEQELDFETRQRLKKHLSTILKQKVDLVSAKFADPIIL